MQGLYLQFDAMHAIWESQLKHRKKFMSRVLAIAECLCGRERYDFYVAHIRQKICLNVRCLNRESLPCGYGLVGDGEADLMYLIRQGTRWFNDL